MPRMKSASLKIATRLKEVSQTWLDVGCGDAKQNGCIGMDRRKREGVDVVHDAETLPWPFADETFNRIVMSHIMEHLNPKYHVDIVDEMWRVLKPNGILMMAMPYPGSHGFWQDPTHLKSWNETTPRYFDPDCELYSIYKPKPWKIEGCAWRSDGNIEIVMRVRK